MENPDPHVFPAVRVATAGEALIDMIQQADGRYEPCLGGAVYNLTRALALQGVGTMYLNPLSGDRLGRQLHELLVQSGAQLASPHPVPEVTSLAMVGLDGEGHPTYDFYRQGVADRVVTAGRLTDACAAAPGLEVVCTGALALDAADSLHYLPWLSAQRDAGRVVVVDANLRPSVMRDLVAYRANVRDALGLAHLIKVSDEDLQHLQVPGEGAMAQAWQLLKTTSATALLLTLGADGAAVLLRDGGFCRAREVGPVPVADTVGAGDCFLAGFLAALLDGESLAGLRQGSIGLATARAGLARALASATLCVMETGCQPPRRAQVLQRVREHPVTYPD